MLPNRKYYNNQKGQALFIVLLLLAVVLVLVLSVMSRSLSGVSFSTREDASTRSFSAAEAGVEQALLNRTYGSNSGNFTGSDATWTTNTTGLAAGSELYEIPEQIVSGESVPVWFAWVNDKGEFDCTNDLTGDGVPESCFNGTKLEVCWGKNNETEYPAAVEVTLYYDSSSDFKASVGGNNNFIGVKVARLAFDPKAAEHSNNFNVASTATNCGTGYLYSTGEKNLQTDYGISCAGTSRCLLFGTIKAFYNSNQDNFAVKVAGSQLPSQGLLVNSRGTYLDQANTKLETKQTHRYPLSLFESAIYSKEDLVK